MAKEVYTNDEDVLAKTPEEFHELVEHFVKYPDERIPYMKRGYQTVMKKHTYFHRVSKMLEEFDMPEEAEKCLDIYSQIKPDLGVMV